jgi:hypothetical protein
MPLVYSDDRHILRVDGDVLETFIRGTSEQRILLAYLAVQAVPIGRGTLALTISSAPLGTPLYEALPKAKVIQGRGPSMQLSFSPQDEPVLRAFFNQVALLCDRPLSH